MLDELYFRIPLFLRRGKAVTRCLLLFLPALAIAQTVTSPVDSALNVVNVKNTKSSWRVWPLVLDAGGALVQVEPPVTDVFISGTQLLTTFQPSAVPYTIVGLRAGVALRGMGFYMTECPLSVLSVPCEKPFLFDVPLPPLSVPAGLPVEVTYNMPLAADGSVIASVGDTRAPTAPGNLVAVPFGTDGASLTWIASADNVGVASYAVERCTSLVCTAFAKVGTPTVTTYSDTGLAGAQSYSYRVQALDLAGNRSAYSNIAAMTTPVPPPSDTTPPVVSITAPLAGVTVAGTVTLTASASDNVGVVGVQFGLDSANFSAEITAPPYTTIWNTTTVADGSHTLNAVARDAAGNRASSSLVVVQVSNAPPPPPSTGPVFTRLASDSFAGTALGAAWATTPGELPFKVIGGAAIPTSFQSDNGARYVGAAFPAGQYSRGNLFVSGVRGDRQGIGFVLRQSSTARTNYRFVIDHAASGNASITKRIAGTGQVLAIWSMPFTDGDRITFAITATGVLYVFDKNGAVAKTIDDSAAQIVGGTVGIDFSSISTSASIRNWEGGAFSPQ